MAKGPASDTIMTPDKMKPLLALSKREPVQAAIGLTTEGEGLILLDKKAKPKKVLSLLRGAAGKAKLQLNTSSLRFGRAEVDTDYDSGMVRFFINKDAPGNMRIKLVEVVKRIPYQKVEINVDPSLEEEPEDEIDAVEAGAPQATTATAPETAPTTEPSAPGDAELRHLLAAQAKLIPEAAGTDAARRAALLKIAAIANDQLKSGDLAAAGTTIEKLRQVINSALGGGARTTQQPGQGKAMAGWQTARAAALQSLKSLETAVRNFKDARSDEAVILLRAIQANLTGEPSTPAQVNELVGYLKTDRIITEAEAPNGFGITVQLRAPLLQALAELEREQASAGVAA